MSVIREHVEQTEALARALPVDQIYEWLVSKGYYPEAYVLPPCFAVVRYPTYAQACKYYSNSKGPPETQYLPVQFPKTNYTDRRFGVIEPRIHSDIALDIAENWQSICDVLFDPDNRVCGYSFPLPVDLSNTGRIGSAVRSGRMIYEWIEMAEMDLATLAHRYSHIGHTDITNFYPSIYTHTIAWALHGKEYVRKPENRHNLNLVGNRLDRLFQRANDGRTNGIPIGPVVSDLVAEVILSAADKEFSALAKDDLDNGRLAVVRFKDDYRVLAVNEHVGIRAIKHLQVTLSRYNLELHDQKTVFHRLPQGLFREWVSRYHRANPTPKDDYTFKRFREVYLAVLEIEANLPGTGVIDRFLADLVDRRHQKLRLRLGSRDIRKTISLLLMLAEHRTKAFPKVLAIVGALIEPPSGKKLRPAVKEELVARMKQLSIDEEGNRYLLAWIMYFLRSYRLWKPAECKLTFSDPVTRAIATGTFDHFKLPRSFKISQGIGASSNRITLLQHLDVFRSDPM